MIITPEQKARLEAAGHKTALLYIDQLAIDKSSFGQVELREIHRLIFVGSWPEIAGKFRSENVQISGTSYLPPHWQQVPTLLYQALQSFNPNLLSLNQDNVRGIVELAAQIHYDITAIHPFRDGNGRVARLVVNYVFRYFSLPYVVFPKEEREHYIDALESANQGNMKPFINFIVDQYERSLDQLLGS